MDFLTAHQPRRTGLAGFLLTAWLVPLSAAVFAVIVVRVVIHSLDLAPHTL